MRCLFPSPNAVEQLPDRCGVFARVGMLKIGDKLAGLISPAGGGQESVQALRRTPTPRDLYIGRLTRKPALPDQELEPHEYPSLHLARVQIKTGEKMFRQ